MIKVFKRLVKYMILSIGNSNKLTISSSANVSLQSTFEGANKIDGETIFHGSMGYGSYIGRHCELSAHIGRFSSIAAYVRSSRGCHPVTSPYVTTSPMFYSTRKQSGKTFANRMMFDEVREIMTIGNDCWIGENVFIVSGVAISDGAVVLAGAVVTKDVPPYAIVGGVPAKVVKYRYDEDTIRFLLDFKWWERDIQWLYHNWEMLCDIERLKQYSIGEE